MLPDLVWAKRHTQPAMWRQTPHSSSNNRIGFLSSGVVKKQPHLGSRKAGGLLLTNSTHQGSAPRLFRRLFHPET